MTLLRVAFFSSCAHSHWRPLFSHEALNVGEYRARNSSRCVRAFMAWLVGPNYSLTLSHRADAKGGGGHSWAEPPQTSYCAPPTFHDLSSLLNVIDFESETDKTVHARKKLHALASASNCTRSQMVSFPPNHPPLPSTHNGIFTPPPPPPPP